MAVGWDKMIFKISPTQNCLWFYNKEINCIFVSILNVFLKTYWEKEI